MVIGVPSVKNIIHLILSGSGFWKMSEEICPKCQNRFWFFHGDMAVECPCVEDSEFKEKEGK